MTEDTSKNLKQAPWGSGVPPVSDNKNEAALEVVVEHGMDKAMKILKRKLIKEGLFKELKARRYFEKPCEKRKRKRKESEKKARKENARQKRGQSLFS
ncbi:MAG: 30S ribosomal protein S21 [Bdellovibrionota bacterium]